MVRSQFKGELDILDRNSFTQATESVVNMLCKREGEVNTVLECLDVLVQVGHMWPDGCSGWVSAGGEDWGLVPGLAKEEQWKVVSEMKIIRLPVSRR